MPIENHPREEILKRCAEVAPQPWFPRSALAAGQGDPARTEDALTELWTHGLIQRAGGDPEKGPAFTLTEDGRRLLADPGAVERLRQGHLPTTRASEVREALLQPGRPVVTYVFIAICVVWFLAGLVLAIQPPSAVKAYLIGLGQNSARYFAIQSDLGVVQGTLLVEGQWWRLLTSGFVHFGALHLLMNMWFLRQVGRDVESMWGPTRYLVIYLLSLIGGSCLAMAYQPLHPTAGASGALCGVLAALAVWVFLNGKYLPPAMARRARGSILTTGFLIIIISLLPFVSGWGHLGGALAGGAAALLFQAERIAPKPAGRLALLGLPAVLALSWYTLEHAKRTDPAWAFAAKQERKREAEDFEEAFLDPKSDTYLSRPIRQARKVYGQDVRPLFDQHPNRRDPDAVQKALGESTDLRKKLEALARALEQAGPYEHTVAEEARTAGRQRCLAWARLLELAEQCLRAGNDWKLQDDEKIREQEEVVEKLRVAWGKLLR